MQVGPRQGGQARRERSAPWAAGCQGRLQGLTPPPLCPCRSPLPSAAAWWARGRRSPAVPAAAAWWCALRAPTWPRCVPTPLAPSGHRQCAAAGRGANAPNADASPPPPRADPSTPAPLHEPAPGPAWASPCRRARCPQPPQVERVAKAGGLYKNFTSGQALSYLDGTLPGGACACLLWPCWLRLAGQCVLLACWRMQHDARRLRQISSDASGCSSGAAPVEQRAPAAAGEGGTSGGGSRAMPEGSHVAAQLMPAACQQHGNTGSTSLGVPLPARPGPSRCQDLVGRRSTAATHSARLAPSPPLSLPLQTLALTPWASPTLRAPAASSPLSGSPTPRWVLGATAAAAGLLLQCRPGAGQLAPLPPRPPLAAAAHD